MVFFCVVSRVLLVWVIYVNWLNGFDYVLFLVRVIVGCRVVFGLFVVIFFGFVILFVELMRRINFYFDDELFVVLWIFLYVIIVDGGVDFWLVMFEVVCWVFGIIIVFVLLNVLVIKFYVECNFGMILIDFVQWLVGLMGNLVFNCGKCDNLMFILDLVWFVFDVWVIIVFLNKQYGGLCFLFFFGCEWILNQMYVVLFEVGLGVQFLFWVEDFFVIFLFEGCIISNEGIEFCNCKYDLLLLVDF